MNELQADELMISQEYFRLDSVTNRFYISRKRLHARLYIG